MGVWVETALFGVSDEQVRGATGGGAGQGWMAREQARATHSDNNGAVASDGEGVRLAGRQAKEGWVGTRRRARRAGGQGGEGEEGEEDSGRRVGRTSKGGSGFGGGGGGAQTRTPLHCRRRAAERSMQRELCYGMLKLA